MDMNHLICSSSLLSPKTIFALSLSVTGPAKTGDVDANYTPSLNKSFLNNGTDYLCSVTCTIQLIKFEIGVENFMAIGYQHKSYVLLKFEKAVKIYVPACPVFAVLVTFISTANCS